ncbi:MAG: hypothetical protein QXM75_01605 [Candidatus Diapherotrites archaeon]
MKGFLFSMDSLFSTTVLLVLLVTTTFYIYSFRLDAFQSAALYDFASDFGTVLEKGGYLTKAIDENSVAEVSTLMNASALNLCIELRVYDSEDLNAVLFSTYKVGCVARYTERTSYKRSFFSNKTGKAYLVEVLTWYR